MKKETCDECQEALDEASSIIYGYEGPERDETYLYCPECSKDQPRGYY